MRWASCSVSQSPDINFIIRSATTPLDSIASIIKGINIRYLYVSIHNKMKERKWFRPQTGLMQSAAEGRAGHCKQFGPLWLPEVIFAHDEIALLG
jgi:hypothetical protein